MQTVELIALVRDKIDDRIEPYLISDDHIIHSLNDAQREFASRTLCCSRADVPIMIEEEQPFSFLDPSIIRLRSIRLPRGNVVRPIALSDLLEGVWVSDYGLKVVGDWEESRGLPVYAVTDMQEGAVRWVPKPIETGRGTCSAYVYPEPMSFYEGPGVPEPWHSSLANGAVVRLRRSREAVKLDLQGLERWEMIWAKDLIYAYGDTQRNTRGAPTARFNRRGVW